MPFMPNPPFMYRFPKLYALKGWVEDIALFAFLFAIMATIAIPGIFLLLWWVIVWAKFFPSVSV